MATRLNHYWNTRHDKQRAAGRPRRSSAVSDTLPEEFRVRTEKIALKKKYQKPYEEPSSRESFRQVFQELLRATSVVPESKKQILLEVVTLVADTYEYSITNGPVP